MQDWLRHALKNYAQAAKTFFDVESTLHHYPSLLLKHEDYVNEDAQYQQQRLVCLVGTIPVGYRGQRYNIPIRLWMPQSYPNDAPIVYVEPTASMVIRPSSYVMPNGRVYSPCQQSWGYSLPAHEMNLVFLLSQLCEIFSNEPPVYAKSQQQPQQPTSASFQPQPVYMSPSPMPTPPPPPPPQQQPIIPSSPMSASPSYYAPASSAASFSNNLIPPPPPARQRTPPPSSLATGIEDQNHLDNTKLLSLRTALVEKISSNMEMARKELEEEAELLAEKRATIETHGVEIESALRIAEQEIQEIQGDIKTYKNQTSAIRSFLSSTAASNVENVEPDEYCDMVLLQSTKQSEGLTCEIQALDDTIYQLSQMLYQERIDLPVFLKNVRMLARQVFLDKALLLKVESMEASPSMTTITMASHATLTETLTKLTIQQR